MTSSDGESGLPSDWMLGGESGALGLSNQGLHHLPLVRTDLAGKEEAETRSSSSATR